MAPQSNRQSEKLDDAPSDGSRVEGPKPVDGGGAIGQHLGGDGPWAENRGQGGASSPLRLPERSDQHSRGDD